ncbi:hypothetical protein NEOLEDRAFT_1141087, partial [Neolentinus lepideus HHB14362 ss-1]
QTGWTRTRISMSFRHKEMELRIPSITGQESMRWTVWTIFMAAVFLERCFPGWKAPQSRSRTTI